MIKKAKRRTKDNHEDHYKVPWLSEKQSQVCGRELRKIAEREKVNDIRSLRPEKVWAIIEADKNHPMREVYDFDVDKAARAYWIEQTRRIITGIRVVTMTVPDRKSFEPMFYNANCPTRLEGSHALRRARVLRDDVMVNEPVFRSAVNLMLRRMISAFREMERIATFHPMPEELRLLLAAFRADLDRYNGAIDAAAE